MTLMKRVKISNWRNSLISQSIFIFSISLFACNAAAQHSELYISPAGNDVNPGSFSKPFKTLGAALNSIVSAKRKKVSIYLRAGIYRPDQPILITPALLANHQLQISSYKNEKVI